MCCFHLFPKILSEAEDLQKKRAESTFFLALRLRRRTAGVPRRQAFKQKILDATALWEHSE